MLSPKVGVLGASCLVGARLLSQLAEMGCGAVAFSRKKQITVQEGGVEWRQLPTLGAKGLDVTLTIDQWICVTPIWVLPNYFSFIRASGAQRVVVLSSTSRFSKIGSDDTEEKTIAARLVESEERVQEWAEGQGIEWVVLRPTLIYGFGQDRNITAIARFIRRYGFFPLLGPAQGLRQPIHADDVAAACVAALQAPNAANRAYNISGGETLTYREMVARVFAAVGHPERLLTLPLWVFRLAGAIMPHLPRYRHWSTAMVERMNRDLVFDAGDAARDLGFKPKVFSLAAEDL